MRALAARLVSAGLFALLPAVAGADCAPTATQSELNACTGAAFEAADKTLNTLYSEIRQRLEGDAATLQLLTLAQRAWVGWRDTECDLEAAGVTGGSIYPMIRGQCLTDLTAARIATFHRFLDCAEGDLSCPIPSR